MKVSLQKILLLLTVAAVSGVVAIWLLSTRSSADTLLAASRKGPLPGTSTILYPGNETIFPPEIAPPKFRWSDAAPSAVKWLVAFRCDGVAYKMDTFTDQQHWTPLPAQWEAIKKLSMERHATITVIGLRNKHHSGIVSRSAVSFSTSKDSVGNPLFYREVVLPFSEAVKDPSRIKWRFGAIGGTTRPPVVLENLPVCGNCHSFSRDGKTLGMDVDYANDKGAYAITTIARETFFDNNDIITWSDYKRDGNDPTFGLLSQVSPDGRFVMSTVKDRSVFVATPDLAFSQLFFPIQGILAVYSRDTKTFAPLPGADDTAFVQSNPSWSPDGKYIVFARSKVHRLRNLHDKARAILSPEDCSEFLTNKTLFKYDLYRIPFTNGQGGLAEPLTGASGNGMSNYFARYSPDGRWIVFCKSNSFMLLQPDSKLYILPAEGGDARLMRCNADSMNSWHSWSSNSRWLVFASKRNTPYTQLFITHIDADGNDAPPVLLEHLTAPDRAANIPEFVYTDAKALEKIHEQFIDDVSLWRSGMSFEEAGDMDRAFSRYQEALARNPISVKAHISAGNILEKQGKTDEALKHYLRAVQLDSSDGIARINAGNIYLNRGDLNAAIEHYTIALRLTPDNGFAQYNLAEAYVKRSNYRAAQVHFMAALRLMPDDALTHFALGKLYVHEGRTDDAILQFTEGVRLLPDDPDGYRLLADALLQAGRHNEAASVYRKALRTLPESPEVRLYLANILRQPEELVEARRLYGEVLQVRPDLTEARDSLAGLAGKR